MFRVKGVGTIRVFLNHYAQMRQPLGGGTTSSIRLEHWTNVISASCTTRLVVLSWTLYGNNAMHLQCSCRNMCFRLLSFIIKTVTESIETMNSNGQAAFTSTAQQGVAIHSNTFWLIYSVAYS
jgi:hypothetical protein